MESHRATVHIDAPPDTVWRIVSDVTRTPEWSPVCRMVEWTNGATEPTEGATFRGHNRKGLVSWSRDCKVTSCEPGRLFAFSTYIGDQESTRWRYELEPAGDGTKLTEAYQPVHAPNYVRVAMAVAGNKITADARDNVETSLLRIKQIAEASPSTGT